ncbi:hypothetical protein Glove_340g59 [Diversispora epigaea]|uniref:Uncharacterized protein n=1 Tax=Diversispora epigaea TaxID=1348612 RepID=A0A397HHG7_9GLOM|nr:hypothetical protein Glove_340g59 [Diversispora epigaea]
MKENLHQLQNRNEIDNKKQTTETSTKSVSNIRKMIRKIAGGNTTRRIVTKSTRKTIKRKPTRIATKSAIRKTSQELLQESSQEL